MCLLTPQQETIMARPRPVYDGGSPPSGAAALRLATLASAPPPPKGGWAEGRRAIYRKSFTPATWSSCEATLLLAPPRLVEAIICSGHPNYGNDTVRLTDRNPGHPDWGSLGKDIQQRSEAMKTSLFNLTVSRMWRIGTASRVRCLAVLLLLPLGIGWAGVVPSAPRPGSPPKFHPSRVLVKPKAGAVPAAEKLSAVHAAQGARVLRSFSGIGGLQVVELPGATDVQAALENYRRSGAVEYAEPDFEVRVAATPNDPQYASGVLWALNNTGQNGVCTTRIWMPRRAGMFETRPGTSSWR